ncbi:MAG: phosphatidylinositol kinase [Planctomycetes bacterium]|nr:phosphatidylinositol kinase [Planctomycetota bacterium]
MYKIHRVDPSLFEAVETLGAKRKSWFRQDNKRVLFKAETRGTGEDWAEKIACELCRLLGLPHVHYELAHEYDGKTARGPGVICDSCASGNRWLMLGNQLLLTIDSDYPAHGEKNYKVSQHTVGAVVDAIDFVTMPTDEWMQDMPFEANSALDIFVGYVMLDAWIANPDRHHQNWAVLWDGQQLSGERLQLAPTFDHGASLARNLSDEERKKRLTSKDMNYQVPKFAARARSAFYGQVSDERTLGTHEAFWQFAEIASEAAKCWLKQLQLIKPASIQAILDKVPEQRMSMIAKEFTLQLLSVNQQRLLEENLT